MPRHGLISVLVLPVLLAGCSSAGGNFTYREYGKVMGQAFHGMFAPMDVPRDTAAAIPYASMGYRLNGGDEAILVLATQNDQSEMWTASSHVVIQTDHGRITRTVGLPHDIGALLPQRSPQLTPPQAALKAPFAAEFMADYPQIPAYGVALTCSAAAPVPETITVLGQAIATLRVDEACESRALNWRFVDSYWLDATSGFAWRTRQHLGPGAETIDTEIFRPPG